MNRFYIKSIGASGPKVEYSSISFGPNVNILHGPSNTGKSYVISCINFMLGSNTVPFKRESTGYDTVHMSIEVIGSGLIQFERKIVNGKKKDAGSSIVKVTSSIAEIQSTDYSIPKNEYSDLLLKLMGIEKQHQIISTQAFKPQSFTIRSFIHSFFIDEDNIYEKIPAFDVPRYSKITACLTALHFLFRGEDLHEIVPTESEEELKIRKANKNAIILYIHEKIQGLTETSRALEHKLSESSDSDIEAKMETTLEEIAEIERHIYEATEKSKKTMEEIYDVSTKLEEATYLRDSYTALHTQYNSDIKRLRFIIDGETKGVQRKHIVKCPFCDNSMNDRIQRRNAYGEAAQIELDRITLQLKDLKETEKDIQQEINILEAKLVTLEQQNEDLAQTISQKLKPKATQLQGFLDSYKYMLQIKYELSAVNSISSTLNTDAFNKEIEEDSERPIFSPMEHIDKTWWEQWSNTFETIVKECGYPNCTSARLSPESYDAIVNGKHKSDEGKGYRAFLNSIILFSLMKTLETNGIYRPAMLILDSPILTLKEKVSPDELADVGMRISLFNYMIQNCGDNQIIIAENEIPDKELVNYSTVNLIEFTQNETQGVYGFLKSIRNGKNN